MNNFGISPLDSPYLTRSHAPPPFGFTKVAVGQMTAVGDQDANFATCRGLAEVGPIGILDVGNIPQMGMLRVMNDVLTGS